MVYFFLVAESNKVCHSTPHPAPVCAKACRQSIPLCTEKNAGGLVREIHVWWHNYIQYCVPSQEPVATKGDMACTPYHIFYTRCSILWSVCFMNSSRKAIQKYSLKRSRVYRGTRKGNGTLNGGREEWESWGFWQYWVVR